MCGAGHAVAGAVRELRDHGHDAEVFSTTLEIFFQYHQIFSSAPIALDWVGFNSYDNQGELMTEQEWDENVRKV